MSTAVELYQDFLELFQKYSVDQLIEVNNQDIKHRDWISSRGAFRSALLHTLSARGLDLSKIIVREDGFTSVKITQLRLEDNIVVPIN